MCYSESERREETKKRLEKNVEWFSPQLKIPTPTSDLNVTDAIRDFMRYPMESPLREFFVLVILCVTAKRKDRYPCYPRNSALAFGVLSVFYCILKPYFCLTPSL